MFLTAGCEIFRSDRPLSSAHATRLAISNGLTYRGADVGLRCRDSVRRTGDVMMRVALLAVAFGFLTSPLFAQGAADKGKEVYAAQKCSICHSIGGVGNKKGPLDKVGS